MRIIVFILIITSVSEVLSYIAIAHKQYTIRYTIYHIYDIIVSCLIFTYFIQVLKPVNNRKMLITGFILWPLIGVLNILFLQPLTTLNTNMILLESFAFISLSLLLIYVTLKNDLVENIFTYPHFWMAVIWLVLWSSSFFFWAFVKILYRSHWQFMHTVMYLQAFIEAMMYFGIAATLFFYRKKMEAYEKH